MFHYSGNGRAGFPGAWRSINPPPFPNTHAQMQPLSEASSLLAGVSQDKTTMIAVYPSCVAPPSFVRLPRLLSFASLTCPVRFYASSVCAVASSRGYEWRFLVVCGWERSRTSQVRRVAMTQGLFSHSCTINYVCIGARAKN